MSASLESLVSLAPSVPSAAVAFALALAAVVSEFRAQRIPNPLTYAGVLAGTTLGFVEGHGTQRVVAFVVVAFAAFGLYRRGVLGGGAVKLLAALAMVLGAAGALPALALVARVGAAVATRKREEPLAVTTAPACAIGCLLALAVALAVRFLRL